MTTSHPAAMAASNANAERSLREEFRRRFGVEPRIFRAPGRVNLIGEHTDYNQGYAMPAAIEFSTWVAIAPRDDAELHISSLNLGEERIFGSDETVPAHDWTDYVRGVAHVLGAGHGTRAGANVVLWGNVPLGAGLSSSASLEVATAVALLGISDCELDREEIALLCQRAENEFVGARCGIMDQFIAAHGEAGHGLLLDCRSLQYKLVPLPSELTIVIANTMIKHRIAGGEYNRRRAECEEGVSILQRFLPGIRALRDVSLEQLEEHRAELPPVLYRRCRHVISENARVLRFAAALRSGDCSGAGELMLASHESLRNDYEVSCRELDTLVSLAQKAPGTAGSRMTGGGFGGCTVSLVRNAKVAEFQDAVAEEYNRIFGVRPEMYTTHAAAGAGEVTREE